MPAETVFQVFQSGLLLRLFAAVHTYLFYFLEYGSYKIKCSNNDILDIGPNPMAFNAKPIENGDAISKYATFYMPKYGKFYGIVMDISQQTTFCLSFNTVSSEELSKLKKNLVI